MKCCRFLFFLLFFSVAITAFSAPENGPTLLYLDFHTGEGQNQALAVGEKKFNEAGLPWKTVPLSTLENKQLFPQPGQVLLVSESEFFPADAIAGLEAWFKAGGNVIFTGGDLPFTEPAVRDGDYLFSPACFNEKLKKGTPGHDLGVIKSGMVYRRQAPSETTDAQASASVDQDTLNVHASRYARWETWVAPANSVKIPANAQYLRVEAKGDAPSLSIELKEEDGSRWIASFALKKDWETFLLPRNAFRVWASPKRAGAGDGVRFEKVKEVVIGLSDTHTPGVTKDGSYRYAIRHLEALTDVADVGARFYPPAFSLEGIAPNYKSYQLSGPVTVTMTDGKTWQYAGNIVSTVPRMTGLGITMKRPWRFIPRAVATNQQGGKGYPSWIMLYLDRQYKGCAVAGMGFSLDMILKTPELTAELITLAKQMSAGYFLAGGGPADFIADVNTTVRYGAEFLRIGADAKVRVAIHPPTGTPLAHFERTITTTDPQTAEVKVTRPGVYRCTVELLDSKDHVADRIVSELVVLDGKPDPAAAFIRVENDNFILQGKKWYPNGVNFYPVYGVAGLDAEDYKSGWGDRRFYDPALVEEMIVNAQAAGINLLSVHPSDNRSLDPKAIRDLLYRCRKHGMKLNLFVGAASPLDFQENSLQRLIDEARLRGDAALFCYDIIWEATNYIYRNDHRQRFRPEWNRWVTRQYGGDIGNAVADWKFDPGADEKGLLHPPTDEQFKNDGDHRVFVAAYRRFMDDHTAKLWQRAVDRLRKLDPNHLVTNRSGNIHAYDNGFSGPVKALDFLSPEGYTISHDRVGEGAIGFSTRLIDYYSSGKPIIWSEFGMRVNASGYLPNAGMVEKYARYNELFYHRGLEAGAQGFAPWWWPGGYRVNERSDFGITNVDGSLRLPGQLTKDYAKRVQTPRDRRVGNVAFDFDPDKHAGGYPALVFGVGSEAYLAAVQKGGMLQIRTEATGKTSVDVPIRGVGNVPYTGKNPVKYLNGAFEKVEYKNNAGQWTEITDSETIRHRGSLEMRLKIANMGEVPFIAKAEQGAVAVRVALGEKARYFPIKSDLPRLKDATLTGITLPATVQGEISFRFEARNRAVFGEDFRFILER